MESIYTSDVIQWCVSKAVKGIPVPYAVTAHIGDYVKEHSLKTVEVTEEDIKETIKIIENRSGYTDGIFEDVYIKGIPHYSVYGNFTYFEMLPGVWRPILTNIVDYQIFLSVTSFDLWVEPDEDDTLHTMFKMIYGKDCWRDCMDIHHARRGVATLNGITQCLPFRAKFIGQYVTPVVKDEWAPMAIPVAHYYKDGDYARYDGKWRYVCKDRMEVFDYLTYLINNKLL